MGSKQLTNNRLEAGFELFRQGKVRKIGNGLFIVEGSRQYTVDTIEKTCTCPDWQHRGGLCKHLYAALFAEGKISPDELASPLPVVHPLLLPVKQTTYEENVW